MAKPKKENIEKNIETVEESKTSKKKATKPQQQITEIEDKVKPEVDIPVDLDPEIKQHIGDQIDDSIEGKEITNSDIQQEQLINIQEPIQEEIHEKPQPILEKPEGISEEFYSRILPPEIKEKEDTIQVKELSSTAKSWKNYLEYQKITPQQFLKKYPNHKFKAFVEEIMLYEVVNNKIEG